VEPEQLASARVSPNFFDVLQAKPLVGRGFQPEEGEPSVYGSCYPASMRWTSSPGDMGPGEVLLFHFDGKSRVMCAADGTSESPSPTRFANKQEADAYANRYVAQHPRRGCRLYDSTGERIGDVLGASVPAQRYTRSHAKRDLCIGLACLSVIPIGFLFPRWPGPGLILGMIIATKFVLLGIVKLSEGIAGLMDTKPR